MNGAGRGKCRERAIVAGGIGTSGIGEHLAVMRAQLTPILLCVALAACSSQTDKQLAAVKSARSVLAEWARVEELSQHGKTTQTYTNAMRKDARDQLATAQGELTERAEAVHIIDAVRMGNPGATALHRADDALKPLEDSLESS
jgi:hypothetical protein